MNPFLIVLNFLCCLAAIWLLRDVLLKFFNERIAVITLLILFLGTNYFDLVTGISPAPFNYRFTLFVLLLWLTLRWHNRLSLLNSVLLGADIGLIILLNPLDLPAILFPFAWGIFNRESFNVKIKSYRENVPKTIALLISAAIPVILMVIFRHPLCTYFRYPGIEQHGLLRLPGIYMPQFLLSWHNGWLIYTPMAILAIIGFYFLASREPKIFYATFGLFFLSLLTVSSWSTYDFADELGRRQIIPYYPLLALPLGFLLNELNWKRWIPAGIVILFLAVLNLFQTWQFRDGILHPQAITKKQYMQLFGRTSLTEKEIWKLNDGDPDPDNYLKNADAFSIRTLYNLDFEDTLAGYRDRIESKYSRGGSHSFRLDATSMYTPSFNARFGDLPRKDGLGLRLSAYVLFPDPTSKVPGDLVISSIHKGKVYRYRFLPLDNMNLSPHAWNPMLLNYVLPMDPLPDDTLTAFIYYRGKSRIYIDDVKVELFDPKSW